VPIRTTDNHKRQDLGPKPQRSLAELLSFQEEAAATASNRSSAQNEFRLKVMRPESVLLHCVKSAPTPRDRGCHWRGERKQNSVLKEGQSSRCSAAIGCSPECTSP